MARAAIGELGPDQCVELRSREGLDRWAGGRSAGPTRGVVARLARDADRAVRGAPATRRRGASAGCAAGSVAVRPAGVVCDPAGDPMAPAGRDHLSGADVAAADDASCVRLSGDVTVGGRARGCCSPRHGAGDPRGNRFGIGGTAGPTAPRCDARVLAPPVAARAWPRGLWQAGGGDSARPRSELPICARRDPPGACLDGRRGHWLVRWRGAHADVVHGTDALPRERSGPCRADRTLADLRARDLRALTPVLGRAWDTRAWRPEAARLLWSHLGHRPRNRKAGSRLQARDVFIYRGDPASVAGELR